MYKIATTTKWQVNKHQKSFVAGVGLQLFLLLILIASTLPVLAQPTVFDSVNKTRYQLAKTGFTVLGTWAVLNIGAGLVGQQNTTGEKREFYKANVIGGLINLGFAGVAYFVTKRSASQPHSVAETFRKQAAAEKIFLFSVGLDLGAVVLGFYTKEKANRFTGLKSEQLRGAGKALIVQGTFLTLFDGMLYLLEAKNGSRLYKTLQKLPLGTTENGFGLVYPF